MNLRCLIIDDSSVHQLAISLLIKNHPNLELVGAYSNPYEGIAALYEHNVDILFLDVLLEDIEGFEILEAIEIPATVILNSSWGRFASKAKEYGIQHFLVKPIRKQNFESTVEKAIQTISTIKISA